MDDAIIYIGLAQSVFSAFLIYFKKPSLLANKILGLWLFMIALLFSLNVYKISNEITIDLWPISANIIITFPVFLFLYTKYIVTEYKKFILSDLIHFTPLIIGVGIAILYIPKDIDLYTPLIESFDDKLKALSWIGYVFKFSIWFYSLYALIIIYIYRTKTTSYYSFYSNKINLRWLVVLIVSFFIIYNLIIYISSTYHLSRLITHIERFRSGSLLIFVYIVSIWGFRQHQLSSNVAPPDLNLNKKPSELDSERYTKSGLKDEQAEKYMQKLIDYMNNSLIWQENELSLAKLADETQIPKHYITQVLNEHIKKNFYTFVNEYRTEYAMKLIKSPKYKDYSFVAIAFESGFNSKTAFNIFFKKYTGMTPSEFKKKE
ncbi:helix-turn-helix domain-containing protein [Plebeiibacterium marinum]|uniref:Helix-turn-helix domain-containing protein n=1 Tax=Plebeiibacterium marinum TaxID=2992111 RepID=A0AAE3MG20_9BACT|nr:helix-turn-helix domain-containing protein [Plebeiobacterium marinum]MCW3807056.1 helix-turn-helix domain-containing protein [Plebeiobacterium marinum]